MPDARTTPWLFMAPSIVLLLAVVGYPILLGFKLSLYDWQLATIGQERYVGLANYIELTGNERLWGSIKFTLFYALTAVCIEIVLGTALALLLNQPIRGMRFFNTLLLAPIALSPVAVGVTWKFFLNADYGTMTFLLQEFGIADYQTWLVQKSAAPWVLIGIDAWWSLPFVTVVLLAGLKSLPPDPFEAAQIDGARSWQSFFYITLPLLRPVYLVVLVIRVMDALRVHELVFVLTQGGPGRSTSSLSFLIWQTGFKLREMGNATAIGMVFLVFIVLLTAVLTKLLDRQISEVRN
jgi:multiple sugar transport system permease protein